MLLNMMEIFGIVPFLVLVASLKPELVAGCSPNRHCETFKYDVNYVNVHCPLAWDSVIIRSATLSCMKPGCPVSRLCDTTNSSDVNCTSNALEVAMDIAACIPDVTEDLASHCEGSGTKSWCNFVTFNYIFFNCPNLGYTMTVEWNCD